MSPAGQPYRWKTLDTDLNRLTRLEAAAMFVSRPLVGLGASLGLAALAALAAGLVTPSGSVLVGVAAALGVYMALTIGANDVANNMGPAVGANALPMAGAIALAALCETAGALLAGGDVVATVAEGIVAPESFAGPRALVAGMMAALLSAAVWVNLATWIGAPVSTTHSIVGGVLGAGVAAAGFGAVSWPTMGAIAASWVIAPLLGGLVAAAILALVNAAVIHRADRIAAARSWVPVLIGFMAAAFAAYLALQGLSRVAEIGLGTALLIGLPAGLAATLATRPLIRLQARRLSGDDDALNALFRLPLVVSAALLSFAHGANDVANAVGPLAAIIGAEGSGAVAERVAIPFWVLLIGAAGISFGLVLFGPRLIRMVGSQITKLNPMRAYCVALSAAVTVIAASSVGLPVSSTHIAIGGVFGVGFYREWQAETRFRTAETGRPPELRIAREERRRRKLVRRSHFLTIVAAWIVTVPAAALLSALVSRLLGWAI